jgi:hypothetical protein
MNLTSIDVGVRRALKAYKIEKGMSPSEAEAWATRNLTEAVKHLKTEVETGSPSITGKSAARTAGPARTPARTPGPRSTAARVNDEEVLRKAFASLKTWAKSRG